MQSIAKNIMTQYLLERRALIAVNTGTLFSFCFTSLDSSVTRKGNIVYKMQHPAYYARTNTKIDSKFFKELNRVVYYHFGEKIEWFTEEKYIENEEVYNCQN